jgi:hypothetical protein
MTTVRIGWIKVAKCSIVRQVDFVIVGSFILALSSLFSRVHVVILAQILNEYKLSFESSMKKYGRIGRQLFNLLT